MQTAIQRIQQWIAAGDVNEFLRLDRLNLRELPPLPAEVQRLDCSANRLRELPALPAGLKRLVCSGNRLTGLPNPLPAGLERLYCSHNNLTGLPDLPLTLKELLCTNNKLVVLPNLPPGLETLNCSNNKLTVLPKLHEGLDDLDCFRNLLTTLPKLPESLTSIRCVNNPFKSLPPLPAGVRIVGTYNLKREELQQQALAREVKARETISEPLSEYVRERWIPQLYAPPTGKLYRRHAGRAFTSGLIRDEPVLVLPPRVSERIRTFVPVFTLADAAYLVAGAAAGIPVIPVTLDDF
jgi:Leucine-rich repeat (LRR) protein